MKRIILFLSASLLLASCVKDNDPVLPEEPREWYLPVSTDTILCTDVAEAITGISIGMNTRIVRATFMYHSMFDTTQTSLSGCVCWPLGCQYNEEIWLENHYTATRWDQCPSQSYMPGMIMCHTRQAIYVGSDYMGLGLTRDLPAPYFNNPLLARQSIDCFKAALQVLKDNGISLASDFSTYNFGYSLGGSVSLGVAKLVEQDPELKKAVHLKKSFCGGGPYDQMVMIESYVNNPKHVAEMPVVMALDIETLKNSNLVSNIGNLFTDSFNSSGILEMVESRLYDTAILNSAIRNACGPRISDCLSPELLDTTGTLFREFRDLHKAFDLTEGWEPTIPLLFFHSKADGVVSYDCMESFRNRHKGNPVVTYLDANGSHGDTGELFYKKIIGEVWMED